MTNILFVCLGNICRSPLAEGFFKHHCHQRNLDKRFNIASAGTGNWHLGKPPDSRAIRAAAEQQVNISRQRARQVKRQDFTHYDWLIAMDRSNLRELENLSVSTTNNAKIALLSALIPAPEFIDVPDPWYGDYGDFQEVAGLLGQACASLLDVILAHD